jgi:hypothetical protein
MFGFFNLGRGGRIIYHFLISLIPYILQSCFTKWVAE